jgi:hypothetical protein
VIGRKRERNVGSAQLFANAGVDKGRIEHLKVLYSRAERVLEATESREGVEAMLKKERELTKTDMQKLDIVRNAV